MKHALLHNPTVWLASLAVAVICTAFGAGFPALAEVPAGSGSETASSAAGERVPSRGEYIVMTTGCGNCHTPCKLGTKGAEPDMSKFLSGHPSDLILPQPPRPFGPWGLFAAKTNSAFAGPWGVSYASNLTADAETGIGVFTDETFIAALRTGKHLGTERPILPPMAWQSYKNFTDDDLKAVFAYLNSVAGIKNSPPPPEPPTSFMPPH